MQRKRKFNRTQRFNPLVMTPKKRQQTARGVFLSHQGGKHTEERKNIDVIAGANIAFGMATAIALPLNVPCIEGTSPTTHVGRRIKMKSIFVRWQGSLAPTTTGASPLRLLVVYDKQPNAATAAANVVLTTDVIQSPMNLANNKRFVVVIDELIPCVGTSGPTSWAIERYRKIDLDTEFNETDGGTSADVTTGLMVAYFYQNGNLLIANPSGGFYSRIRFVDA